MIKTEHYELAFDPTENRVFWKVIGHWRSVDAVPDFDRHWNEITRQVRPGFTILADLREMNPMPEDVVELNQKKQAELMALGCRRVAQVSLSSLLCATEFPIRLLWMGPKQAWCQRSMSTWIQPPCSQRYSTAMWPKRRLISRMQR